MNTRSLSVVRTEVLVPEAGELGQEDRSLLYYEDPTGKVIALSQQAVEAEKNNTIDWYNITSQASQSLLDEFRNIPAPIAGGLLSSKTLYESLGRNTALSVPFTCGANWTGFSVGAIFYAPRLYSPNVTGFQFVIEGYENGPVGPGNFSQVSDRNNCR